MTNETIETKTCNKCGKVKAVTAFSTAGAVRKDGTKSRKGTCEVCVKKERALTQPIAHYARKRRGNARARARKHGCEVHNTAREHAVYREAIALELADGIKRHVDHIIPLADGGPHRADNLQILTVSEHNAKNLSEMAQRRAAQ